MYMSTYIHVCIHTYEHIHIQIHGCVYTYMHAYIHAKAQRYSEECLVKSIHTYVETYAYLMKRDGHSSLVAYIQKYIHKCMYI